MVNYAIKNFNKGHMAKAMGRNLPISFKQTVEVCNFIRGKSVNDAKDILKKVSEKKMVVPFKRFNRDLGHKKKIGAGRFPVKTSNELMKLLEAVEANAQFKGLNTSNLTIMHICAHKGSKGWHFGRKRRRQMKRTNVEVIVEERVKKEVKGEKKEDKK
jgi:large subunit ribosomal protein L22